MKHLTLLIFFVALCLLVLAKPGKDGKPKKFPSKSLKAITACKGQPVDLSNQIDSFVQQCLDNRTQEIEEQFNASNKNGGKEAKKREKKKAKLAKKMMGKCTPECEWKAFDLIPDVNGTSTYPPVEIPDTFLKGFPDDVQETLKTKMETCYNITSPLLPKAGKKGVFKTGMCLTNKRLMKCLGKSLRQTCRGKVKPSSAPGNATAPNSGANAELSTPATKTAKSDADEGDDDDDDDEDDLDDDKDDDENDEDDAAVAVTTKGPSPSTPVDMSKPITK